MVKNTSFRIVIYLNINFIDKNYFNYYKNEPKKLIIFIKDILSYLKLQLNYYTFVNSIRYDNIKKDINIGISLPRPLFTKSKINNIKSFKLFNFKLNDYPYFDINIY
jgi:hypothetical protein